MLSAKQIDFYKTNGYLTISNVINQDELNELKTVTEKWVNKSRSITEDNEIFVLELNHSSENPRLKRIKEPYKVDETYKNLVHNNNILDIVEDLIGPNIRLQGTKLNMKASGGGQQVEWHTDWGHYPHTNDDLLAVGVALDDMTEKNGCLLAIPGSHKQPETSHHEDGYFVGAVNNVDMNQAVPLLVKAGGISIHHVRTLHASAPNFSNKERRFLLLSYRAVDAFPLAQPETSNWDAWNSCIIRGKPTIQPRLEKLPVFFPGPIHGGKGNIFAIQSKMKKSHFAH